MTDQNGRFNWRRELLVPLISALIGAIIAGFFALSAVKQEYKNQKRLENAKRKNIIYHDLNSILQEIADNFEYSFANEDIFSSNSKTYQKIIGEQKKIPIKLRQKPIASIKAELDTVAVFNIRKPHHYEHISTDIANSLEPPEQEDSVLFGIYSMIRNYYGLLESYNSRLDAYLVDYLRVKDVQYMEKLSSELVERFFEDIGMQERLLQRKSNHVYQQGKKCAFLIEYYVRNFFKGPHPSIVPSENEKVQKLIVDTLVIERYKPIEILPDMYLYKKLVEKE